MQHKVRDLARDWRADDAEKLAVMERESAVAWPGGGGWQVTPEEIERWLREGDHIGLFAAEDGDRIVSLCTLMTKPGQREHCYVPHLNCHPDYHGKKFGKAVLHAAVECSYREGFTKIDLNTWSGNMRAVPLYKKSGFMWRPDTTVFMENFTPSARRHPLGAAYFARHDWYQTLQRTVTLEEDLMLRGRVRVYEYLWRADDGDELRMVFDSQSWRLIEVETNELMARCALPDRQLVAGVEHPVEWEIVNKQAAPVPVFLRAGGDPGVDAARQEVLTVDKRAAIAGALTIDPEIAEKDQDPKVARLDTHLVIDGQPLELSAGIEVQQAVDIWLDTARSVVAPGGGQGVVLSLRSQLDRAAVVHLDVGPLFNADVAKRKHRVELAPHGGAELALSLKAHEAGGVGLEVAAYAVTGGDKIPIKKKRLDLLAAAPGGAAACAGEEEALLVGGGALVAVSLRSGEVTVYNRLRAQRAERLQLGAPRFGPPFSWQDLFQVKGEAAIEGDAIRLRSRSVLRPGVVLDRRVRLLSGGLVEVVDAAVNGSARALDLQCRQGWNMRGRPGPDHPRLYAPRADGVYTSTSGVGGRGLESINLPQEGAKWPEGWLCRENGDGTSSGVVWRQADVVESGFYGEVQTAARRVKPGQAVAFAPFYGYVGGGGWREVRDWWRLLCGEGTPEHEGPLEAPRRPIELALTPSPLVVAGDSARAKIELGSAGTYALDGALRLRGERGVRANLKEAPVKQLQADKPVAKRVRIERVGGATGARQVELSFATNEAVYRASAAVLLLPAKAKAVAVARAGEVFALGNGLIDAQVAPGFVGSVVSLQLGGEEFLNSSYPKGGIRGWRNPWHGGIVPVYDYLWGRLHREQFRGRIVERKGAQGLKWRGVQVRCEIADEQARGRTLELEYLLTPGVPLLAVVLRVRDQRGLFAQHGTGFELWPKIADKPGLASFHTPHRAAVEGLSAPHSGPDFTWDWGGLEGRKGRSIFIAACGAPSNAGGWAEGPEGCALFGRVSGPMPAHGAVEGVFFVVPGRSAAEAEAQEIWSGFGELP